MWDELDSCARVNLSERGFNEFIKFKEELKQDGHGWENDAYGILVGFIWDTIETEDV